MIQTPHPALIDQAVALAEQWQNRANQLLTSAERRAQAQLTRLLSHPRDKALLSRLIDQSFRCPDPKRVADQLASLVRASGVPEFLAPPEKGALMLLARLPAALAAPLVPGLIERMREASSHVIIPGEPDLLAHHLHKRRAQKVRVNLNRLGEAVLGEDEAARRLAMALRDLEDPEIECISLKISTLFSQINPLAFDRTVALLKQRLSRIYRAAAANPYTRPDGSQSPKFVTLDMEEYRDLAITWQVFAATLDQEEFVHHCAGMVLQAYLPDSFALQQQLTEWARERVARGGAPVRLRIVKGANMEMERLEAALHNWPLAPFDNKPEVDANFKRMLAFALEPDHIAAVRLGVGSHNLFDLAYARTLARANGVEHLVCYEMLEGMADHLRRALQESGAELLLYAPVAAREEFINGIAYLIRRLDENTAPDNFLRAAPGLKTGTTAWQRQKEAFVRSFALLDSLPQAPHRTQDRTSETGAQQPAPLKCGPFANEPDTDWALAANRRWAEAIRARWMQPEHGSPLTAAAMIDGKEAAAGSIRAIHDPGRKGVAIGQVRLATAEEGRRAVEVAAADPDGWRSLPAEERQAILARAAMELRASRGELIGAAAAETGKVFAEADPEVSEAIDFTEFYPLAVRSYARMANLRVTGRGVVLVIAPWNFPIAIPCGSIAAALAAGNTVLFKPATEAALTGRLLCECFWRAGVPKRALQFVPCQGSEVGPLLTANPRVDVIVLTGGTDTGLAILARTPEVFLAAETGGKNATIVTDLADRDQAIKHVLISAFSNSGQKCSATSLLVLTPSLYGDAHFRSQLVDAAASLPVGPAWDFSSRVGPLIRPPAGALLQGLTTLEAGETWALKPAMVDGNPHLWSPGIKYGVAPGSFTHLTELFGPVLGVMRADNLEAAIDLVNRTGYGLTSGLESLDPREQALWRERIRAGNLYINRPTTGAMVLRQPFGGMGKSALGAGLKVGCHEYVTQLMQMMEIEPPEVEPLARDHWLLALAREWQGLARWGRWPQFQDDIDRFAAAVASYLHQMEARYGREQDFFHLRGQDNRLRFAAIEPLVVRLHADDSLFDTLARIAAARVCGAAPQLSRPPGLANGVTGFLDQPHGQRLLQGLLMIEESDSRLAGRLAAIGRLRYGAPQRVPAEICAAAAKTGAYIARAPVYMEGRIELLQYLRQQSVCDNYHRYGNLGERADA